MDCADAKPIETKAVEKNEMLAGGCWLVSRFDGDFGPIKFVGVGQWGYDPVRRRNTSARGSTTCPHT